MISLTRLNGSTFYLNPDVIWLVDTTPDTVITMVNGEHLLVKETPHEVSQLFIAFKLQIHGKLS
jgi:flagellar protein FlbD